jgi:hypothetical protein
MIDVLDHIDEENIEEHHEVINRNHNYLHSIDHLSKNKFIITKHTTKQIYYFHDKILNYLKQY